MRVERSNKCEREVFRQTQRERDAEKKENEIGLTKEQGQCDDAKSLLRERWESDIQRAFREMAKRGVDTRPRRV